MTSFFLYLSKWARCGFLLVLSFTLFSGCLVSKSEYDTALKKMEASDKSLRECQQRTQLLEQEKQKSEDRSNHEEQQNRKLLEDLASLGAEQEEMERRIARFQKEIAQREQKISRVTDTYRNLMDRLSQEVHEGKIRIDQAETRLKLNLVDKILFPSGSAQLTSKGKEILEKVGNVLRDTTDRRIMIEGHTDNVPLSNKLRQKFASNWELSAVRATAVVRFLQNEVGLDPRLLSATGHSMYQPLVPNDTNEMRQSNRRIEIILIPLTPKEIQELDVAPVTPTAPTAIQPAAQAEEPAEIAVQPLE